MLAGDDSGFADARLTYPNLAPRTVSTVRSLRAVGSQLLSELPGGTVWALLSWFQS